MPRQKTSVELTPLRAIWPAAPHPWIFKRISPGSNPGRSPQWLTDPRGHRALNTFGRRAGACPRLKMPPSDKAIRRRFMMVKKFVRTDGRSGWVCIRGLGLVRWPGRAGAGAAHQSLTHAWVGGATGAPRSDGRSCTGDIAARVESGRLRVRRRDGFAAPAGCQLTKPGLAGPGVRGPFAVCRRPDRSTGRRRGLSRSPWVKVNR